MNSQEKKAKAGAATTNTSKTVKIKGSKIDNSKKGKNSKSNADTSQNIPKETRITKFFGKAKTTNNTIEETTSTPKTKLSSVFLRALEQQNAISDEEANQEDQTNLQGQSNDAQDVVVAEPLGPNFSSMIDYIQKLESMLADEKIANSKLSENYSLLKKKYVANLQLLAKTQNTLIQKSQELNCEHAIDRNTADVAATPLLQPAYIDIGQYISTDNLNALSSISSRKSDDPLYVRKLIAMLYSDTSDLVNRTLTGRRSRKHEKQHQPITPEKVKVIRKLFVQRIENESLEERINRSSEAHINRLISNAITYYHRKSIPANKSK